MIVEIKEGQIVTIDGWRLPDGLVSIAPSGLNERISCGSELQILRLNRFIQGIRDQMKFEQKGNNK